MQSDQGNSTSSVGDEELQLLSSMFCDELHAVRPCGAGKELELLLPHGVVIVVLIPFGYPQECPSVRVQRGPTDAFCEVLRRTLGSIKKCCERGMLVPFVQQVVEDAKDMIEQSSTYLQEHECAAATTTDFVTICDELADDIKRVQAQICGLPCSMWVHGRICYLQFVLSNHMVLELQVPTQPGYTPTVAVRGEPEEQANFIQRQTRRAVALHFSFAGGSRSLVPVIQHAIAHASDEGAPCYLPDELCEERPEEPCKIGDETNPATDETVVDTRPAWFESLPYDCVFTVLRFLLPNQTVDFARCSQRCYSLATDDGVWCEYWQRYNPSHLDVRSVRTQIPWSYRWSYLLEILDLQWSIGLYAKDIPHRCAQFSRAITRSIPRKVTSSTEFKEEFKEMINAKRDQVTALAWNDLYYRTTHQHAKEWAHIQVNMLTGNYYTGLKLAESFPFQEVDPRIARLLRMPGDEESIRAFIRKYDVLSLSSREGAEVDAVLSSVPRKQIFTAVTLATNEGEGMEFQRSNSFDEDSKECQRTKQPRKKERKMRKDAPQIMKGVLLRKCVD